MTMMTTTIGCKKETFEDTVASASRTCCLSAFKTKLCFCVGDKDDDDDDYDDDDNDNVTQTKKIKPLDMACEILDASSILTKEQLKTVIRSAPSRYHMRDWACTYAMKKDGASLERMSRSLKNSRGKIIIFKDSTGARPTMEEEKHKSSKSKKPMIW
eukprot:jgi/Bigna1/140489/aug1.56_g15197